METGSIMSINVSCKKGKRKYPIIDKTVKINFDGILTDAHYKNKNREISILTEEDFIEFKNKASMKADFGIFAENLDIKGIKLRNIQLLDKIKLGNDVMLEVTQIGKKCHGDGCPISKQTGGYCVMPIFGVFCRPIKTGNISIGDNVLVIRRKINLKIILLSDRVYKNEMKDTSLEFAMEVIEKFFYSKKWDCIIETKIIPDDVEILNNELENSEKYSVIFTIGGTGISNRDITPETVLNKCSKVIPGIMENIRNKYSDKNKNVLLSRSVSCIFGSNTQVYTLPGNKNAVNEYLTEILPLVEHIKFLLDDVNIHEYRGNCKKLT